jgi:hypothetical protein
MAADQDLHDRSVHELDLAQVDDEVPFPDRSGLVEVRGQVGCLRRVLLASQPDHDAHAFAPRSRG